MSLPPQELERLLAHVDANLGESLDRWFALLRIPSISTDPAYAPQCRAAADWLAAMLGELGFDAAVRDTDGNPMVVGHRRKPDGLNAVFYGHYDVQPVDPLGLWASDPFEPVLAERENGEKFVRARGAADDKGLVMTFVEACRAFLNLTGDLPIGLSFLIEGEEESASRSFAPFVTANAAEFEADLALVCDTGMWDKSTPAIVTSLRGLVAEDVEITCASRDLHSGGYGSAARNPNQVIADIIASLRNPDGSVAVEGFYDDVREVPPEIVEMWNKLDFDGTEFLASVGLTTPAGEKGRTVFEQINARPTCEINGISGGYAGPGFKTVIPSKANAKISFRLVADQDPHKVRDAFRKHVRDRLPPDCTVKFEEHGAAAAVAVPYSGPHIDKARQALMDEWGTEPVLHGGGGSIPAVETIKKVLGLDALMIGFSRKDDAVHSPNEKLDLESFHKGIRSWVRILAALG
ncbi:MAG: M20/M25/M40 family metallo-hydrolase [Hyphomicrobiaceae bacterium]|nr:M20/M25/M40 family metallo-hydrolase [Hyphomicrobiaceae bacterium]